MKINDTKRLIVIQNKIIRCLAAEYRSVAEYEQEIKKLKEKAYLELKKEIQKKEQLKILQHATKS